MSRPIIIAECCQSHNGSFDTLRRMLDEAAEAGADYVKIQSIRSNQLTHRERFDEGKQDGDQTVVIKRPFDAEKDRLSKLDLSVDEEAKFVELCRQAGVKSMTTVFARSTVKEVADLGYDSVKVASYDCASYPLLRDLVQHWDHLVVSTGATTDEEIEKAVDILKQAKEFVLLHCVTIYPTPIDEMHLARMMFLRMFASQVGLSSHPKHAELGISVDKVALALGADAIERHFTVLGPTESKDGPVSMTPKDLKELREFADRPIEERREIARREVPYWRELLGSATRELSHTELLNRDYFRGRFASPDGKGGWVYNWEETAVAV